MKKIEVEIKENGEIVVKTSGFSGKECLNEVKRIGLEAKDIKDIKFTNEAYQTNKSSQVKKEVGY